MVHKKSKYKNLQTIESLLPSLSEEEKVGLFAKFAEANNSRHRSITTKNVTPNLGSTIKPNGSLKRSADTTIPSLLTTSTKVLIAMVVL
jgi:hypothetical protein